MTSYRAALKKIPPPGEGCHPYLLGVANRGVREGIEPEQIVRDILAHIPPGARTLPEIEIVQTVERAVIDQGIPPPNDDDWDGPDLNVKATLAALLAEPFKTEEEGISTLYESIPQGTHTGGSHEMIPRLFQEGEHYFVGEKTDKQVSPSHPNPSRFPFFIPNPFTGVAVAGKNGKQSFRCDAAVSAFRYAVLEFDKLSRIEQLTLWAKLIPHLPIRLLTDSGGKSFHALIYVDCASQKEWDEVVKKHLYNRVFIPLGCDPTCRNPSRLTRTPGHLRSSTQRVQEAIYANFGELAPFCAGTLEHLDDVLHWDSYLWIPTAYYLQHKGKYALEGTPENWILCNETNYLRRLTKAGMLEKTDRCNELLETQNLRCIDFVGPIAGYRPGYHEENGYRFLVTASTKLIQPKKGEWPLIRSITQQQLGRRQCIHFYINLKFGYECLRDFTRRAAQIMAFIGPANCFKSFSQNFIITPVWGGISANAYQYLSGDTAFNADLLHAMHQQSEDEIPGRSRLDTGAHRLKAHNVNEVQRIHAKGMTPIYCRPLWRTTISCNDEAQNLAALPGLEASMKDKINLFRCAPVSVPFDTTTLAGQKALREAVAAELPAFVYDLERMEVPKELQCPRYGIKAYHDESIEEQLSEEAVEEIFWEQLQHIMGPGVCWEDLTASELRTKCIGALLMRDGAANSSASLAGSAIRDLPSIRIIGRRLHALKRKYPSLISFKRTKARRAWGIRTEKR